MLRPIYMKREEIPQDHQSLYAETTLEEGADPAWVLQVERADGWALENVEGLKSALGKERRDAEDLRKLIKDFEGLDAKKVRRELKELEDLRKIDPSREADRLVEERFKSAKTQLVSAHERELQTFREEREGLMKALDRVARRQEAIKAIADAKGNVDVLLPHVLDRLRLEYADGSVRVSVVDGEGNPRIADAKGTAMTTTQLVEEMRSNKTFASCFEGTGNSGTGMGQTASSGTRGTGTRVDINASKEEQNAAISRRIGLS